MHLIIIIIIIIPMMMILMATGKWTFAVFCF